MANQSRLPLVLFVVLVLGLLLGLGWFVLGAGETGGQAEFGILPTETDTARATKPAGPPTLVVDEVRSSRVLNPGVAETSVAWPVTVDLELLRAARYPQEKNLPALGSGREARLSGRITNGSGDGVPVSVTFLHGPNEGRVLRADDEGVFGATDLYPGLSLVQVEGPGIPGALREVNLRARKVSLLNIGFGLPGTIQGTVYDVNTEPIARVKVELDGHRTFTDENGIFYFKGATSGREVPLILTKKGYASYREIVGVTVNYQVPLGKLQFLMTESARLEINLRNKVGGSGDTLIYILPDNPKGTRDFPWHTINPGRIGPSNRLTIEDMPAKKLRIHAFHAGALFSPEVTVVNLHPGEKKAVSLLMETAPMLSGIVKNPKGRPMPNARILLEAPDRVAASLTYFGKMPGFLETLILPTVPAAAQEVATDSEGRFVLSAWSRFAPKRYLQAWNPNRKQWACKIVDVDDTEVELVLEPFAVGDATLELEFPDRHQGLPVVLTLNGSRARSTVLPSDESLVIEGLSEGNWEIRVAWNGKPIIPGDPLELAGKVSKVVALPEGAILGQDEATNMRAKGKF